MRRTKWTAACSIHEPNTNKETQVNRIFEFNGITSDCLSVANYYGKLVDSTNYLISESSILRIEITVIKWEN